MSKLVLLLLIFSGSLCRADKIQLATFEAPPFMSPQLPNGGAFLFVAKSLFQKLGYETSFQFAPLKRAIVLASQKENIDGYVPASPFEHDQGFIYSRVLYRSAWVMAERKNNIIHWNDFRDLAKYSGGANLEYIQPPAIEDLKKNKIIKIEDAADDTLNLLKLAHKRIDYALIDETMFKYILATDPRFKEYAKDLQVNKKVIAVLTYTLGLKKNSKNEVLMKKFNKVASEEVITSNIKEYLQKR